MLVEFSRVYEAYKEQLLHPIWKNGHRKQKQERKGKFMIKVSSFLT
jgi:hypothetical protein